MGAGDKHIAASRVSTDAVLQRMDRVRQLGSAGGNGRTQASVCSHTANNGSTDRLGEFSGSQNGNRRIRAERSSRKSDDAGFDSKTLCSQAERKDAAGLRRSIRQPIHACATLSDGRYADSGSTHPERRLDGQDRPEGRVPACTDPSSISKISADTFKRGDIPVQGTPVWIEHCTASIHTNIESGSEAPTETGLPLCGIPRRHLPAGTIEGGSRASGKGDGATSPAERVHYEHQKTCLEPSQRREFLGLNVDSKTLTLSVPTKKLDKIRREGRNILEKPAWPLRKLAATIGLLNSVSRAMRTGHLMTRSLYADIRLAIREEPSWDNRPVTISEDSKEELRWWLRSSISYSGQSIHAQNPTIEI